MGQHNRRSSISMGPCFFKDQVYERGRFRNTGSHTRTPIIPVTLPLPPPFHGLPYVPLFTIYHTSSRCHWKAMFCNRGSFCKSFIITKTCLYNFDSLKPLFYIVKLGFTGVYIFFLISAQKLRLWVLVRTVSPMRF